MHFYTHTGQPAHFQPNKSKPGFNRPTTVRDAKKLALVPSVTTIQKVIDKPALVMWLQEQPLKFLFENVNDYAMATTDSSPGTLAKYFVATRDNDSTSFARDVIKASTEARSKSTADRGTEIHKAIENYFKDKPWEKGGDGEYGSMVQDHLLSEYGIDVDDYESHPEQYFASEIGYGGCSDLILIHKTSRASIVIDLKSKEWDTDAAKLKRLHYEEDCEQLAAYRNGLGHPTARCINIYVHRDSLDIRSHEWTEDDLTWGFSVFCGAFHVWCGRKRWSPTFGGDA